MIVILLIALYGSVVGMVLLIILKSQEIQKGHLYLSFFRPKLTRISHALIERILHLPYILKYIFFHAGILIRKVSLRTVAIIFLWIEKKLEYFLETVRKNSSSKNDKEASDFLKEVSEHKRGLIRRSLHDRKKYEEHL